MSVTQTNQIETKYQSYIDRLSSPSVSSPFQRPFLAQLSMSEFFLAESTEIGVFANLRIPPSALEDISFVAWVLNSLEESPVASVLYSKVIYHGWLVIQFQSSLAHYLSLAGEKSNPLVKSKGRFGRCADSNLRSNRELTYLLLSRMMRQSVKESNHPIESTNTCQSQPQSESSKSSGKLATIGSTAIELTESSNPAEPFIPTVTPEILTEEEGLELDLDWEMETSVTGSFLNGDSYDRQSKFRLPIISGASQTQLTKAQILELSGLPKSANRLKKADLIDRANGGLHQLN